MIKNWLNKLKNNKNWRVISAFTILLLAGALIEGISFVQYNYAHRLIEEELDHHVESELTLKAARVKGLLKSSEKMMKNYQWLVQSQLKSPDQIPGIIHRLVTTNSDVMSCFVAFVPDYYPEWGRLFEPATVRQGDSIFTTQIASELHDYTQREFYQQAVVENNPSWSDPYMDTDASGKLVTTYAMPLVDETGKTVAAFGIDLSCQNIIDTLNTRHNSPSTFFLLLTEDGQLISRPDSLHSQHSDVETVVRMINDSTCHREFSSTGRSKIVTFTDEENSTGYAYYANMRGRPHWQVVMVCYDDEVYSKLYHMRRNMLLLMLGAFSLLGFILYRVSQYTRRLHESRLNKERTDSELNVAQRIQSEMLPRNSITRDDVEVSGKQITAQEVGGDLYDYFIRDEKLFFCIGDVSGKGVPSSLVMAVVHSFFRSLSVHETDPAHIMTGINEAACEGNEINMFVTLFIGVLDLPTGRLRYCNAGHDAPLIISQGVKQLPVNANLPVGLFNDFKYTQQHVQLPSKFTMFLYTDGLTEASDTTHQLFGLQRIIDSAQQCLEQGQTSPAVLMDTLHERAVQFADGAKQSDDLTMVAINYHRPDEAIILKETKFLSNDVKEVPELNQFIKSVADKLNLGHSLVSQLMLAVEEAVVNVMSYAYPLGVKGDITVEAKATKQWLKFIITDQGKAFDPTQGGDADTTLSAEDRPIGGLGILLVQQLMDSINYERIDGNNVLTLKKDLQPNNNNNNNIINKTKK